MIGWLLAPVLPGGALLGLYVWMWLTVPRRSPTPSTDVVPWQPQAPRSAYQDTDLDAEFGRSVLRAADRYHEMTRP